MAKHKKHGTDESRAGVSWIFASREEMETCKLCGAIGFHSLSREGICDVCVADMRELSPEEREELIENIEDN